jgi:hypothetical protein
LSNYGFRKLTVKEAMPGDEPHEWVNLDRVLSIFVSKEHQGTMLSFVGDDSTAGPYVETPEEIIKG